MTEFGDEVHRIADGLHLHRGVFVHLDAEFGLECGHQLDRLRALGAQVEDKMAFRLDRVRLDAEHTAHHFHDAFFNFAAVHEILRS